MASFVVNLLVVYSLAGALRSLARKLSRKNHITEVRRMNYCSICGYQLEGIEAKCPICAQPVVDEVSPRVTDTASNLCNTEEVPIVEAPEEEVCIADETWSEDCAEGANHMGGEVCMVAEAEEPYMTAESCVAEELCMATESCVAEEPCMTVESCIAEEVDMEGKTYRDDKICSESVPTILSYIAKKERKQVLEAEIEEIKQAIRPILEDIASVASHADENGYGCSLKCIASLLEDAKAMKCSIKEKSDELESIIICDMCEKGYAAADKYCGLCGEDLGQTGWACNSCPTRNKEGNDYCRCCGKVKPPPPPPVKYCVCGRELSECGEGPFCKWTGLRFE